jgi:hypothetical protein
MSFPILKAFVLCENVADNSSGTDQKDLQGAGLSKVECLDPLPVKLTFWVFVQLSDQKESGEVRLAIMRADSVDATFSDPSPFVIGVLCGPPSSVFACLIAYSLNEACTSSNCGMMMDGLSTNDWKSSSGERPWEPRTRKRRAPERFRSLN